MIEIGRNINNPSCPAGRFLRNRILSCLAGHKGTSVLRQLEVSEEYRYKVRISLDLGYQFC